MYTFTVPPMKPPKPNVKSTTPHTAVLTCDLRGRNDDEEYVLALCNNITKEEEHQELSIKNYQLTVKFASLSPDTPYAANVVARHAQYRDLISVGDTFLFTTPGKLA